MSEHSLPSDEAPGSGKMKNAAAALGKFAAALGLNVLARWIYKVIENFGLL
jgi:hypothetical protein